MTFGTTFIQEGPGDGYFGMKLAAISTIRGETDIIVPFLRHLAALFDIVFLPDQRSSDGTGEVMREACAARENWFFYLCDFASRHQKEVNAIFMQKAFEQGADAVFFIDSDEFIGVARGRICKRRCTY